MSTNPTRKLLNMADDAAQTHGHPTQGPLGLFNWEIVEGVLDSGTEYEVSLAWDADKIGRRMAMAFCALGFSVRQVDERHLMRLDPAADQALLKLYDLVTEVRWRQPQRLLDVVDERSSSEIEEQEVLVYEHA